MWGRGHQQENPDWVLRLLRSKSHSNTCPLHLPLPQRRSGSIINQRSSWMIPPPTIAVMLKLLGIQTLQVWNPTLIIPVIISLSKRRRISLIPQRKRKGRLPKLTEAVPRLYLWLLEASLLPLLTTNRSWRRKRHLLQLIFFRMWHQTAVTVPCLAALIVTPRTLLETGVIIDTDFNLFFSCHVDLFKIYPNPTHAHISYKGTRCSGAKIRFFLFHHKCYIEESVAFVCQHWRIPVKNYIISAFLWMGDNDYSLSIKIYDNVVVRTFYNRFFLYVLFMLVFETWNQSVY